MVDIIGSPLAEGVLPWLSLDASMRRITSASTETMIREISLGIPTRKPPGRPGYL